MQKKTRTSGIMFFGQLQMQQIIFLFFITKYIYFHASLFLLVSYLFLVICVFQFIFLGHYQYFSPLVSSHSVNQFLSLNSAVQYFPPAAVSHSPDQLTWIQCHTPLIHFLYNLNGFSLLFSGSSCCCHDSYADLGLPVCLIKAPLCHSPFSVV